MDDDGDQGDTDKEVFAHFGAAYFHAEVLHRGLCNLFVMREVAPAGLMTQFRVEEHFANAFRTTLGEIWKPLRSSFLEEQAKAIDAAVLERNFVAHHFWYERIHLMPTSAGRRAMIAELNAAEEMFRAADGIVDTVVAPYFAQVGFTEEMFEGALDEIRRGVPPDSIKPRRKFKKQERVIRAYEAPGDGRSVNLLFETADRAIWQLCDVGLGWCDVDVADPAWPASLLSPYLPATLDPRPKGAGPWDYDLELNGATLLVRPGKTPDAFRTMIRPKTKGGRG